jgi:hypothetical protein
MGLTSRLRACCRDLLAQRFYFYNIPPPPSPTEIFSHIDEPLFVRPYVILATSCDGGLIEAVPDTISLDALHRKYPGYTTLKVRRV